MRLSISFTPQATGFQMERILDMNTTRRLSEHTEMTTDTQTNEVARLRDEIQRLKDDK